MSRILPRPKFVVATPFRTVCDDNARVLEKHGLLRLYALGTRRGSPGIPAARTRLLPVIGAISYAFARTLSAYRAEAMRMALHPLFDAWVKRHLQPGDHIISSYGYTNACFRWVRAHGGKTFLDAGNSHPEAFWHILTEEHARWKCPFPPVAPHHYRRSLEMMQDVDFVLSPSSFVTNSFLERGFPPERILHNVYPLDLNQFTPATTPRPRERPLTIISTGSLSLRKGTPYLLEAFQRILVQEPSARLMLTNIISDSVRPVLAAYHHLPIDWAPALPHPALAERLRNADVFVLPSLEEGLARTITEALACGLPAVVTPNTGATEFILAGHNGSIVPIRNAKAVADAILEWGLRVRAHQAPPERLIDPSRVSYQDFERQFLRQLQTIPALDLHLEGAG